MVTKMELKLRIIVKNDMILGKFYKFLPFPPDLRHCFYLSLFGVTRMIKIVL